MIFYLDASSLVKLYVAETGSDRIKRVSEQAAVISTSKIAYAEVRAAFARKQKEGAFPLRGLRKIVEELNRDWESYFAIEITDGLIRLAGDLAEKHLLRGFDSIHLASAIHLKDRTRSETYFSSADRRLNESAETEGLVLI